MQNYVIGFEPYNERLCKLRIKRKYNNITLNKVYASTEGHTEETKEQFMTIYNICYTKHLKTIQ
jgi:hypothetical protein